MTEEEYRKINKAREMLNQAPPEGWPESWDKEAIRKKYIRRSGNTPIDDPFHLFDDL